MVIVTGANGFIGSAMVWELNRAQTPVLAAVDVVPLDARPELLQKRKFDHFLTHNDLWGFLENPENIKRVSWIIHMGANSSTTETNKELLWDLNTRYTQKIFSWCARHQKNLIYASSAATYGAGEKGYDDLTPPQELVALNLYGESKREFDEWALQQKEAPPKWFGLKFFNVYGPNENFKGPMASVAFKAFHQIQQDGQLKLFKSHRPDYQDGEQKRDFVYVKDVTSWMWELMQKPGISNGIYNMGFGQARSWNDLAKAVFSSMGREARIEYTPMPDNIRDQYQYFTEAKMTKWLSQGLSKPKWPLELAVQDYIQNYLSQKDSLL